MMQDTLQEMQINRKHAPKRTEELVLRFLRWCDFERKRRKQQQQQQHTNTGDAADESDSDVDDGNFMGLDMS
jgi:hypothetical protein